MSRQILNTKGNCKVKITLRFRVLVDLSCDVSVTLMNVVQSKCCLTGSGSCSTKFSKFESFQCLFINILVRKIYPQNLSPFFIRNFYPQNLSTIFIRKIYRNFYPQNLSAIFMRKIYPQFLSAKFIRKIYPQNLSAKSIRKIYPQFLSAIRTRIFYQTPKNYATLYYAYIVASLNEPCQSQHELKITAILYDNNNERCK